MHRKHIYTIKSNHIFIINLSFFIVTFDWILYIIGFRPLNAGNDTLNYVNAFNDIKNISTAYLSGIDYFHGSNDILFWSLAGVFKSFSTDPQIWLCFNILITLLLSAYSYKVILKEDQQLWGLFVLLLFFTYELVFFANSIRQAYSVPLIALFLHYSYNKNMFYSLFYFILSILFHSSSILFLPVIFLLMIINHLRDHKVATLIILFFLFLVAKFFLIDLAQVVINLINIESITFKFEYYIQGGFEGEMEGKSLFHSINFLTAFFISMLSFLLLKSSSKLYFINLYFLILFILFLNFPILEIRILQYYLFFLPILIFNIFSCFVINKIYSLLLTFALLTLMLIFILASSSAQYILGV